MTTFDRRQRLLDLLAAEPGVRVPDIALRLGVSQGTVRNDLNALAEANQLIRVRGGAAVVTDHNQSHSASFTARARVNAAAKQAIGLRAAELVADGDAILLDASTTVYTMAQNLRDRRGLRVVTNGIEIARLLAQNPTNMVILVGGILRSGTESVTGPWSERFLQDLCTQTAFFSCSGFTPEGGMTEIDVYEAQFRIKAISSSSRVIALVDSSKFGKIDLTPSVRIDQISLLYTTQDLSPAWLARLQQSGVPFTLCGDDR